MLVLGCKAGDRIYLDNGKIVLTVTQLWGSAVRIGVDAARAIKVERESVYRKRLAKQRAEAEPLTAGPPRCLTPCPQCEGVEGWTNG